jgi:hypothetical protein
MLQCLGPATDMVVSGCNGLEDRLMQSDLGSAPSLRKTYGNYRLMERPTRVTFKGIGEHQPLWLDNLAIYASLPLNDPLVFARGSRR